MKPSGLPAPRMGVEEAFARLTQSLTESHQKYAEDKKAWEKQFKSVELERDQAVTASKDLESKLK